MRSTTDLSTVASLFLGAILAVAVIAGIGSYLALGTPLAAWGALGLTVAVGIGLLIRHRRRIALGSAGEIGWTIGIAVFAVGLGLWHISGLNVPTGDGEVVFGNRHQDIGVHAHDGALIRHRGLPMPSPILGIDHGPTLHRGTNVTIALMGAGSGLATFDAAPYLWPICYLTIGLAAFSLAGRYRFHGAMRAAIGGGTLMFSAPILLLDLPRSTVGARSLAGILADPYAESTIKAAGVASGTINHNITQALCVAIGIATLVAWQRLRILQSGSGRLWFLGTLGFVAAGLAKPTILAVAGPMVLIALILRREGVRPWIGFAAAIGVFVGLYFVEGIIATQPPSAYAWKVAKIGEISTVFGRAIIVLGPFLLPIFAWRIARKTIRTRGRGLDLPAMLLIAIGGGLIMHTALREGARGHSNETWALASMLILAAPYILGTYALAWSRATKTGDGIRAVRRTRALWIGSALLALGLVTGATNGIAYPLHVTEYRLPSEDVAALVALRHHSAPAEGFLLDDFRPCEGIAPAILERQALPGHHEFIRAAASIERSDRWFECLEADRLLDESLLAGASGALLRADRTGIPAALTERGWRAEPIAPGFRLWRPPLRHRAR